MNAVTIDRAALSDLQDTAGAAFVAELAETFFEEAPGMFAELRAAQSAGAQEQFRRAAHSIKTNALTFGAALLAASALDLERDGLVTNTTAIEALEAAYEVARLALKEILHG